MGDACKPSDPIGGWTVGTLFQHLTQLLNERRDQMLTLLDERDRRMDERFRAQQEALHITATNLESYKQTANELRGVIEDANRIFLTTKAFEEAHKNLETLVESVNRFSNQRMDGMDRERNQIKLDVVTLMAKSGTVNVGFIMSGVAVAVALAVGVLGYLHH